MLRSLIIFWIPMLTLGCAETELKNQPEPPLEQSQIFTIEFLDYDSVVNNILDTKKSANWSIESILLLDSSSIEIFSAIDPYQVKTFRELAEHITPRVFVDSVQVSTNSLKECFLNPEIREQIMKASLLDEDDYRMGLLYPQIYIKDDLTAVYDLGGSFWWQRNRITLSDKLLKMEFIYSVIDQPALDP